MLNNQSITLLGKKILRRLARYRSIHFKAFLLCRHELRNIPDVPTSAEIRLLRPGEEQQLPDIGPIKLRHVEERLGEGDICYVAVLQGQLVAYIWIKTTGQHDLVVTGTYLDIHAEEFWLYGAWVAEAARGRKLYNAVVARVLWDLAKRGFKTGWAEVEHNNLPSKRGLYRTGWQLNHQFFVIGLGPHVTTIKFDTHFRERESGELL